MVEEFHLGAFVHQRASTYSGGQRRRLDLAATFVVRPALLLLDEPTTGLDPQSRRALWETIGDLPRAGTSVLLTTQYLDEAQALADHIAIIDHGRTVRVGTPTELRRSTATTTLTVATTHEIAYPTAELIAGRLGATITHHRDHQLVLTGQFDLDTAHRTVTDNGLSSAEITEFTLAPPSLDDVFHTMTQKDVPT
ncbi:ATP-binding cassette domain-containing protein [Lipingzhangella sp. LS1_29]|uniref:ATP-binding cassette domain-containing protein n=1 Tax=Lipingzhangella rawalii TaxID=2055835 RepID=A0ABU2HAP2_9ACTN|nr:ATP-binding cassette domain-containing protein [Lipingzhangella rawalii]MDS1272346.1 ATP-binding cassette domain-containing protein [Lipingzhangella rawalii]